MELNCAAKHKAALAQEQPSGHGAAPHRGQPARQGTRAHGERNHHGKPADTTEPGLTNKSVRRSSRRSCCCWRRPRCPLHIAHGRQCERSCRAETVPANRDRQASNRPDQLAGKQQPESKVAHTGDRGPQKGLNYPQHSPHVEGLKSKRHRIKRRTVHLDHEFAEHERHRRKRPFRRRLAPGAQVGQHLKRKRNTIG